MIFPLSEHRLIRYTPEQLAKMGIKNPAKPTRVQSGSETYTDAETGATIKQTSHISAAEAAKISQDQQRSQSLAQQNPQTVTVPGGLTQSQYPSGTTEKYTLPDGNVVDLPRGSNPVVPDGTRLPDGTTTGPVAQPVPATPAPSPTPANPNTVASPKLTGADLQAAAAKRREERLAMVGLTQDDAIRQMFDSGARLVGSQNGQALFEMPDGSKQVTGYSYSNVDRQWQEYTGYTVDKAAAEINAEQTAAETAAVERYNEAAQGQQPPEGSPSPTSITPTPPPMSQQEMVDNAALEAVLSGLPPEAQGLTPIIRNLWAQYGAAGANQLGVYASAADNAANARTRLSSVMTALETSMRETREQTQGVLAEVLTLKQDTLNAQKKAFDERQQLETDKRERELRKKQMADVEGRINEMGFKGGFGSGNGNEAIRVADREWEQAIDDLHAEKAVETTEFMAKFTGLWNESLDTYKTGVSDALKEYKNDLKSITLTGLELDQSIEDQEQTALEKLVTNTNALQLARAKDLRDMASEARDIASTARAEKVTQTERERSAAWQMFNFAFTSSTDSVLRQKSVDALKKAGYDLTGIDMTASPLSIQQKAMDAQKSQKYSPFAYEDPAARQAMASALMVTDGQSPESKAVQLDYISGLLDRGQTKEANAHLEGLAVRKFTGTQQTAYSSRNTIIQESASLIRDLKAIQDTHNGQALYQGLKRLDSSDFNVYSKGLQNLKNKFALDKNPELQRIFARVENIAAIVISDRYGAAVTDGEMARAREYIAMSGNTLGDSIIKLEEFKRVSEQENRNLIDSEMGRQIDYGPPPVPGDPMTPAYDNTYFDRRFGAGAGSSPSPLTQGQSLLTSLADAIEQHEGYGTQGARTITANNNPGALRWHPAHATYGGEGRPGGFTKFPTYDAGRRALLADISAKLNGNSSAGALAVANPTLLDFFRAYAPSTDNNDPNNYAAVVAKRLKERGFDVTVDTPLSDLASLIS